MPALEMETLLRLRREVAQAAAQPVVAVGTEGTVQDNGGPAVKGASIDTGTGAAEVPAGPNAFDKIMADLEAKTHCKYRLICLLY